MTDPQTPIPDDLMPCPFCGAKLIHDEKMHAIEHPDGPFCPAGTFMCADDRWDVFKAWNTRHGQDAHKNDLMKSAEDWAEEVAGTMFVSNESYFIRPSTQATPEIIRAIQQDALKAERARADRLREAVGFLLADIKEYEKLNNLFPSSASPYCWQSVANVAQALAEAEPKEGV